MGIIKDIISPPKAPDPYAVAGAQGAANVEAARATAMLNQANQVTPWGSLTYSQTPGQVGTDRYTATTTLDPRLQQLLDQQFATSLSLEGATQGALGNVQDLFGAGNTVSPNEDYRSQVQDALYSRMTSRLDPMWQQREGDLESRLAAQGLTQGSQAYERELANLGRERTDAYQTAMDTSIGAGEAAIGGQFGRDLQSRNQILNELNALRSGQQVQAPQFQNTATGANVAAAPIAQSMYNSFGANQANSQATMNALSGLGAAAILAPSDRRLKSNIKLVGKLSNGLNFYEYDIAGSRRSGVMADEVEKVMPDAVHNINGILHVDYSKVLGD